MALVMAIVVAAGCWAVESADAKTVQRHATAVKAPVVSVLAEVSGVYPGGLVRSASVRVYDLAPHRASKSRSSYPCTTKKAGKFLVGSGQTGSRGVAVVRLCERHAPALLRVVVSGGRIGSKRFGGTMSVQVHYAAHHAVYVNPPSTLVEGVLVAHPHAAVAATRKQVRRFLGVPSFFDFAGDMAAPQLFNGSRFLANAKAHGGFDRYVAKLVSEITAGKSGVGKSAVAPALKGPPTASGQRWEQAAQSTSGFATFVGFTNVPSEGLPCPPKAASSAQGVSAEGRGTRGGPGRAHAAGLGTNDVFSDMLGIAGLTYSVFSGQGSSTQLSTMQASITQVQGQMTTVQGTLAQLQTQIGNVNANLLQSAVSTLSADAQPTIAKIKTEGEDTAVLLGALDQVICPASGCAKTRLKAPGTVTAAFNAACYPDGTAVKAALATQCNNVSQAATNLIKAVKKNANSPHDAVADLASDALGSAAAEGPPKAGIVQYALQDGAPSDGFFETSDAANARLEWAYYTLGATWAQTTFAEAAGMGIGQTESTGLKHPAVVTAATVKKAVNKLNATIDVFMGAFPNMPDTAVITTNTSASDSDPPYMWAQDVGGLTTFGAFSTYASQSWDLDNSGDGISSASVSGMARTGGSNSAQAPIVMTPAAANGKTWLMLPPSGTGKAPTMSCARFTDWQIGQGTVDSANSTGQELNGPLGDLYGQAPAYNASAAQTRGQWMTTNSGINPALLTITGLGYNAANLNDTTTWAGMFLYYTCPLSASSDCEKSNQKSLAFDVCPPAGDTSCLLPTYYDTKNTPYTTTQTSTGTPTGLFDYNQGQLITNQQGHPTGTGTPFPTGGPDEGIFDVDPNLWANEWSNWDSQGLEAFPAVVPQIDSATDVINPSGANIASQDTGAISTLGRPVLFSRTQVTPSTTAGSTSTNSDCFFWTGGNSAADGSGCLTKRTESTQILPTVPTSW